MKTIDGAYLECAVKSHPALASMMHLLPEHVLMCGNENIPGLTPSPTGKLSSQMKVCVENPVHVIESSLLLVFLGNLVLLEVYMSSVLGK